MQQDQNKLSEQLSNSFKGARSHQCTEIEVISDRCEATLKGIEKVVVFDIKFKSEVEQRPDGLLKQIWGDIRRDVEGKIKKPVWRKFCIYSLEESENTSEIFYFKARGFDIHIQQSRVYRFNNPDEQIQFFKEFLPETVSILGYNVTSSHGEYFALKDTLQMGPYKILNGFSIKFLKDENKFFWRIQAERKFERRETVWQFIKNLKKNHGTKDQDMKRKEVKKALINSIVQRSYGCPFLFRVLDIKFESTMDDILVKRIFMEREETENQDPTFLPSEYFNMTGQYGFDEQRRKSIRQQLIISPNDKSKEIHSFMTQLIDSGEMISLKNLGIEIQSRKFTFTATKQSSSKKFGRNTFVEQDWETYIRLVDKPIDLCIFYQRDININQMVHTFIQQENRFKIKTKIQRMEVMIDNYESLTKNILEILHYLTNINIILIILPNKLKGKVYKNIQKILLEKAIINQVVFQNTLKKKNARSIYTKLFLQMIAKSGNILWVPSKNYTLENTCIMGIYTSSKGGITVMGGCGTTNSTFSLLSSSTVTLNNNDGDKYRSMVQIAAKIVEGYASRNKTPPKELIIFMLAVPGDPVNLLQKNFAKVLEEKANSHMKLTVVMVDLRNSQRFFTVGNKTRNIPPGTLVSSSVATNVEEFYIISQQSTKVIIPTKYQILYRALGSELDQRHLQELIFSQCFNYCNWTGSIKIPAILHFTKKCVKFGAEVLDGKGVNESLLTRPYFV